MRRILQLVILPLAVFGASLVFSSFVSAQSSDTLTPEQTGRVAANCAAIKSTVNQLHASDALLRVNRGQIYESMASGLMDKFNDRLGGNGLDNKAMTTVTSNYRSALNTFRAHYISYEQKLSLALRTDCGSSPAEFYKTLQEARALRASVHEDVQKLHTLIDDYRSSASSFLVNYERLSE